eukprot:13497097-Heterocapsa_arctica.AAC.1
MSSPPLCVPIFTLKASQTESSGLRSVTSFINIVDPARLRGLIQHVADVIAGIDDAIKGATTQTPPPCRG